MNKLSHQWWGSPPNTSAGEGSHPRTALPGYPINYGPRPTQGLLQVEGIQVWPGSNVVIHRVLAVTCAVSSECMMTRNRTSHQTNYSAMSEQAPICSTAWGIQFGGHVSVPSHYLVSLIMITINQPLFLVGHYPRSTILHLLHRIFKHGWWLTSNQFSWWLSTWSRSPVGMHCSSLWQPESSVSASRSHVPPPAVLTMARSIIQVLRMNNLMQITWKSGYLNIIQVYIILLNPSYWMLLNAIDWHRCTTFHRRVMAHCWTAPGVGHPRPTDWPSRTSSFGSRRRKCLCSETIPVWSLDRSIVNDEWLSMNGLLMVCNGLWWFIAVHNCL